MPFAVVFACEKPHLRVCIKNITYHGTCIQRTKLQGIRYMKRVLLCSALHAKWDQPYHDIAISIRGQLQLPALAQCLGKSTLGQHRLHPSTCKHFKAPRPYCTIEGSTPQIHVCFTLARAWRFQPGGWLVSADPAKSVSLLYIDPLFSRKHENRNNVIISH